MCYAVDVDAMLDLTADGHGTKVGSSMYPAFTKYFEPTLARPLSHDVDKAKELLGQARLFGRLRIYHQSPSKLCAPCNTAVVLAEQLKAVGITAQIQQVDWNTWLTEVYGNRDFEATVVGFDASTLNASSLLAGGSVTTART